jgi:uncharacterized protein YjiS (DUF1127 family)
MTVQALQTAFAAAGIPFAARTIAGEEEMTTLSQTAGQNLSPPETGGFFRLLANGVHAVLDFLERRAAIRTLHELDDRALRDIGIARSQIEDAVGGHVKTELMRFM